MKHVWFFSLYFSSLRLFYQTCAWFWKISNTGFKKKSRVWGLVMAVVGPFSWVGGHGMEFSGTLVWWGLFEALMRLIWGLFWYSCLMRLIPENLFNERVTISVLSVKPPPFTGLGRVSLSTSPKSQLAALLVGMDHRPAAPALGSLPPGWQPRAQATQDTSAPNWHFPPSTRVPGGRYRSDTCWTLLLAQ